MLLLIIALFSVSAALYYFLNRDSTPVTPLKLNQKPSTFERLVSEAFEHTPSDSVAARILVLYGTEYGFAKEVALKLASELANAGFAPRVVNALHYRVIDLTKERLLALVCSTTGDGVPPNEAADFRDALQNKDVVVPKACQFGVLALGDKAYPHFCRAGIVFDSLLGESRLVERTDIDQEDWPEIDEWIDKYVQAVEAVAQEEEEEDYLHAAMVKYADTLEGSEKRYSRNDPLMATVSRVETLTGPKTKKSEKEVIRVEFDTGGLQYEVGDALGVVPKNNSEEVNAILRCMASNGDEMVSIGEIEEMISFEQALTMQCDLHKLKPELIAELGRRGGEAEQKLAEESGKEYVEERHLVDVLTDFITSTMDAQTLVSLLRPLTARYYSISSSRVCGGSVGITVDVLRYERFQSAREGVASTFLRDRVSIGDEVGVFVARNDGFRLPKSDKDIVMIGPGTGVAPFVGFVEERVAKDATGKNWLFFGCRWKEQDFLYKERLETWEKDGVLRLDVATSREGDKVYVQTRMREQGEDLWNVIEGGAHVYVCGDGGKMAEDVDKCLRELIGKHGNKSGEEAISYLEDLSENKRYQRDVWVS